MNAELGNYAPDKAIAFKKDAVKHVYLVAETKDCMSSLYLPEIEKGKIAYAEKLFEQVAGFGDILSQGN